MTTLADDGQILALELHALLRDMDSARWRRDLEQAFRARLAGIVARTTALLARCTTEAEARPLATPLEHLAQAVEEALPPVGLPHRQARSAWKALKKRLADAYEELSARLADWSVHLPGLRPTNWARSGFHVFMGTLAVLCVELFLTVPQMQAIALAFFVSGWTMEIGRRQDGRINEFLMWVFGPVAHPHERHRVNSSTWYATGLVILSLSGSHLVCAMALAILAWADPAAATIGRRWGRTRLVNGRSFEGTSAFVVTGTLVSLAVIGLWHPELGLAGGLAVALAATLPAAVAELLVQRIDDNLAIPVASAAGSLAALAWLG